MARTTSLQRKLASTATAPEAAPTLLCVTDTDTAREEAA